MQVFTKRWLLNENNPKKKKIAYSNIFFIDFIELESINKVFNSK